MPYEVQQNTITDGWVNKWYYWKGGVCCVETFATLGTAQAAVEEQIVAPEFTIVYINRDQREVFRIRYVPDDASTQAGDPAGEAP